uniref:C-type lectin domain-containing protein n=1 Tax=Acrobeloides nanus TaxID=290746 RepID=A0A914EAP8_9BILA
MFSIFLLVILNLFTLVLGDCPDGSTNWGALCFQGYIEKETWNKAEQLCSQYWNKGHLVSVTDAYKNSVLPYVFDTAVVDYWIGAKFSSGKWTWSDSNDFTYENWARGQPNNTMGDCAVQRYSDSEWLSHPCSQKKQYICEFPSLNVTRTTTPPNICGTLTSLPALHTQ